MPRPLLAFALLAVGLLTPTPAPAQSLCVPDIVTTVGGTPAYRFTSAYIASLHYAHRGAEQMKAAYGEFDRATTAARDVAALRQAIQAFIMEIRRADAEYRCAASQLDGFTNDENDTIQGAAGNARDIYTLLITNNGQLVAEFVVLLDAPTQHKTGAATVRLADLSVRTNETWKMLMLATVMATYGLIERPGDPKAKLSHFSITAAERVQLIDNLDRDFKGLGGPWPKEGRHATVVSADALRKVLLDVKR